MTKAQFFAITSSMAAIVAATPASAQDSGAASADNEIVVTANKREENLFDVPSSVSAVSDQFIDRIRANNLSDIGAYVPGLNVQPSGGDSNRLIVRGLSTGSQDLSPTVGVYVDDAPFGASTGLALGAVFSPDLDPSDLARVEVLRGPQGTLYGANTLGGLVKFVTKAPDLSNFSGHASIDLSTTRQQGADDPFRTVLRGGVNLPIVQDVAALRVSGFYDTTNGTLTDVRTGRDSLGGNSRKGVRAKLLVEPTDNLSITLSGAYARNNSPRTLSLTADAQTLEPTYGDYADYAYSDSYSRSRYYVLQGNIRYEFANGISLSSTTSYSDFKVDLQSDLTTVFQPAFRASPSTAAIAPFLQFSGPVRPVVKRTTQELRLASPSSGSLEWLVGFFYDDQDSNYLSGINSIFNFGATPPPALAPIVGLLADYQTVTTINHYKEYSGFANAKLSITPTIDLGAGVRYSHNKQAYTSARTGFLVLVGALPASGGGTSSDDVWTASFDASWHFAADSMLYARAARGYRPGGPTATGTSFGPDTTWNYEAGVKSSMMGGKLRTSLAGFFVDWDNIQVNFFNGTNTVIGNAGSARSMGAEFEGSYSPVDGLTLGANLTYTDTKITSLLAGQTTGAALGDELPYVSKWAGALRADYYFPVAGTAGGNLGASLRYRSAFDGSFPGDTGSTFYRLPETAFVDLRAGVELNEGFSVNLQVLNVTDSRKLTSASRVLGTSEATPTCSASPHRSPMRRAGPSPSRSPGNSEGSLWRPREGGGDT